MSEPKITTREVFGGGRWVAQLEKDLRTYAFAEGETKEEVLRNLEAILNRAEEKAAAWRTPVVAKRSVPWRHS